MAWFSFTSIQDRREGGRGVKSPGPGPQGARRNIGPYKFIIMVKSERCPLFINTVFFDEFAME